MRLLRLAPLLALMVPVGCSAAVDESRDDHRGRPAAFAEREVTWAQGSTIHYGAKRYTVDGRVEALWRSSYGFVVSVRKHQQQRAQYVVLDASGTTPIKGEPGGLHVSPDGRYAGFIDFHGPRTPTGRKAAAVVVDLRTGREVLRDGRDMGDADDDIADLYEDAEVFFLGFDDDYAYWDTPVGDHQIKRARIGTWKVGDGGRQSEFGEVVNGEPYDRLTGHEVGIGENGRPSADGGYSGFRSPEKRWCVTTGVTAKLRISRCGDGHVVTPAYPGRFAFFGGWQDADTFYVLARDDFDFVQPQGPDASRGVIASCSLRSHACQRVTAVRRTGSIVFATGTGSNEF